MANTMDSFFRIAKRRRLNKYDEYHTLARYVRPRCASLTNPFDRLPIEMNQAIAMCIPDDRDLFHYRATCRSTADAIESDRKSFWRRRFSATFDSPIWREGAANDEFRSAYLCRRRAMRNIGQTHFRLGHSDCEIACLETLRDMFIDALVALRGKDHTSKNLDLIREFAMHSNLLSIIGRTASGVSHLNERTRAPTRPFALLYAIQVLLAPDVLSFHAHIQNNINDFPTSQQFAYGDVARYPMFAGRGGREIDMAFIARNLHFWKYHMTQKNEALYPAFAHLEDHERPRYVADTTRFLDCSDDSNTPGPAQLGDRWKGSFAYVDRDEVQRIRLGEGHEDPIQDIFDGEMEINAFQDLEFFINDGSDEAPAIFWPDIFEQRLPSHLPPARPPPLRVRTRQQHHNDDANEAFTDDDAAANEPPIGFRCHGRDSYEEFLGSGWFNTLPPQYGVPGWQRMIMMKYFIKENGCIDEDALWAYEGVVLPGDQIILGRWWSPADGLGDEMYSGPFILWRVDGGLFEDQ